jgi:hypothetical protein
MAKHVSDTSTVRVWLVVNFEKYKENFLYAVFVFTTCLKVVFSFDLINCFVYDESL